MAPRLSRWIAMTGVAAVLVATLFLTTGGSPLLFSGYGQFWWEDVARTPLQRRIDGVQRSLLRVRVARESLELSRLLDEALRGTAADPVVFRWSRNSLVADPVLTAELQPLWATLPVRRPEVRTVVVLQDDNPGWSSTKPSIDPNGRCLLRRTGPDGGKQLTRAVRGVAGECLMAERFGVPGKGFTDWASWLRTGFAWEHSGREFGRLWWGFDDADVSTPAWFSSVGGDLWTVGGGWRYRPVGRSEMACLVGRVSYCGEAVGVGSAGWSGSGARPGEIYQRFPNSLLPRDLLTAVGPERFGRIWTSDEPIATTYREVVGTPMDGWLEGWATRYTGPVERDNGLSLLGWIGAVTWLTLLALLTAQRLKQRTVT